MQANIDPVDVVHVQEGRDRIQINEVGIQLLYGIAITALFACIAAFFANLYFGKGIGNWGAIVGIFISALVIHLLRRKRVKFALKMILWGFALIPS